MEKEMELNRRIVLPFGDIEIYSKDGELYKEILGDGRYKSFFAKERYCVYMGWDFEKEDSTYRGAQMKRGIYLGHNIGEPCKLHICGNNIYIYAENKETYKKVFWSFVVKFIFTKACLLNSILHLKATVLRDEKDDMLIMVFGKGGSGKTTLADNLCKYGFQVLSNTHCFLKENYVWGIDSWVRRRKGEKEEYNLDKRETNKLEGNVKKYLVIEGGKTKDMLLIEKMNENEKYYYLKNFAAAISNYDLKEEVFDYMVDEKHEAIQLLKCEDDLVKRLSHNEIYNVQLDSMAKESIEQLVAFLRN